MLLVVRIYFVCSCFFFFQLFFFFFFSVVVRKMWSLSYDRGVYIGCSRYNGVNNNSNSSSNLPPPRPPPLPTPTVWNVLDVTPPTPSVCIRRCHPYARKSAARGVNSRVQLAHPSCDTPNASRRFALGASDVCLVGEKPTCSVPAFGEMRGSMVIRQRPCTT